MKQKREEIDELRKAQAEEAEKQRKEKEQQRKQLKQTQNKFLEASINAKEKINKSLDINQKQLVSKAKGEGMSGCIVLWKQGETAGEYDKKGYLAWIKSISDIDDPNYEKLVQINAAVSNNKNWSVLQGMIECLL